MSTYLKVILVGNVGADPETKHFDGGGQLSNLSVATTETWKDKNTGEKKELTEWSRVVFNGNLSKIVDQYVKKGDKILVEGKLRTRKWQDQGGVDHYTTEVVARSMTMLGSKPQQDGREGSAVNNYNNQQQQAQSNAQPQQGYPNSGNPDDLPF